MKTSMMNSLARRTAAVAALTLLASSPASLAAADAASAETILPVPAPAREVLNQSCVMCHGEVIDGAPEIREDLDLSTDEAIRTTLADPQKLREMIAENEMPHKAKLSFRLRKQPQMQERLAALKADYDQNGSKEKLLAWLDAVLPPAPPREEKESKAEKK